MYIMSIILNKLYQYMMIFLGYFVISD